MTIALFMKLLLFASLFLVVFALALRTTPSDALYLFTHPGQALRAFVAIFVVVPAVAVVIALAFDLHPAVKIALIAMALSPLPPVLPGKQLKAGGGLNYVTGLLFWSALVSLVAAPLGLMMIDVLTPADLKLQPRDILAPIFTGITLPLILGMIGRRVLGEERADHLSPRISKAATVVMGLVFLVLLVVLAPAMWKVLGDGTIIALGVMVLAGLAAGWLLGSKEPGEKAALALAASARHPGVAIAIAATNFPNEKLAPAAILIGLLLSVFISIPFMKRIGSAREAAGAGNR